MKIEIKNRWTGKVLFEYETENNTIKRLLSLNFRSITCAFLRYLGVRIIKKQIYLAATRERFTKHARALPPPPQTQRAKTTASASAGQAGPRAKVKSASPYPQESLPFRASRGASAAFARESMSECVDQQPPCFACVPSCYRG